MIVGKEHKQSIVENGFVILEGVYTSTEVDDLIDTINRADSSNPNFRKSKDLFAVRQFFKEMPETIQLIFTEKLCSIIDDLFGKGFFVVKSIYFDKPENSNWFVAYHQDLTISVDKKIAVEGFGPWTVKHNQFSVQPPISILEANFTIRIHLDDTDGQNGALHVIPASHLKGITRPESIDKKTERETTCIIPKGGIMIMKPLLHHASGRTLNNRKRRVIHIEFSNKILPPPLQWAETLNTGTLFSLL